MTLNQFLTNGQSITSPLGLYTLSFDTVVPNFSVTCNIPGGGQKSIISAFGSATFVKLAAAALVINTTPPTVVASLSEQPIGLDMQDNGNVVIYDSSGNIEWTWYFATGSTTPAPAVLFEADVFHVQEAIDILQVTFGALRQKVAALQPANSDGGPSRMESGFPAPMTDTHARKIA